MVHRLSCSLGKSGIFGSQVSGQLDGSVLWFLFTLIFLCYPQTRVSIITICPGRARDEKVAESPCSYQRWNIFRNWPWGFRQLETMVTITGPWKIISLCSIPVNQAMPPLTSKAVILKKRKGSKNPSLKYGDNYRCLRPREASAFCASAWRP